MVVNSRMVNGVSISYSGAISDIVIPAKTADVLDWIRKKYKTPSIQFQGKIQDPIKETQWFSVFASSEGDEDHVNMHMLPSPFQEETYIGTIVILATESDNQDEYEETQPLTLDMNMSEVMITDTDVTNDMNIDSMDLTNLKDFVKNELQQEM